MGPIPVDDPAAAAYVERSRHAQLCHTLGTVVLGHANVDRQPPEESALDVPVVVVPEPERAEQLRLFSVGEPRTNLLELQPNDEEFPGDLLGMYYLG
jgi:hypothetical protein